MFRTQLRAVLRCGSAGQIFALSMLARISEIRQTLAPVALARAWLDARRLCLQQRAPGAMIEMPRPR